MKQEHTRYTSDWTQNWNGSIAIKLTAIILWSVMIAGFALTAPIMLSYEEDKLKDYAWDNQRLIHLIEANINNQQSKSSLEHQLEDIINTTEIEYASIESDDLNISLGLSSDKNHHFPATKLFTRSGQQVSITIQNQDLKKVLAVNRVILGTSILIGAILFGVFIFLVTKKVVHNPLQNFVDLTRQLSKGEKNVYFDEDREDEFGELARFSNQMLNHLGSQRKKLADTNSELTLEIQSREEALAATLQKSAFLANMSHEIRTPLSSIIGYTERLRYKNIKTEEERNEMMDIVLHSSNHLRILINDILDFSKIEANKLEIETNDFSIFNAINQTVNLLNDIAMERSNHIKVDYTFPIPKLINNDATRTKQILLNLCSNALKFTQMGTVTIQVSFDQADNQLVVAVKDTGIGMSEKVLNSLFKPFSQGDLNTSDEFGGTGLGLVISKRLAELMGGDVTVISTKDLGSIFTFKIDAGFKPGQDLINEIDVMPSNKIQLNKPLENLKLSGKVLLVEDTAEIRQLVKAYLEDYGIDVTTADNGQLGVELALNNDFDVVLMDIQMPVMNGKEAIKLLRRKNYTGPIIALTADALAQQIKEYQTLGFTQTLTKPIVINEVINTLSLYLDTDTTDSDPDRPVSDHERSPEAEKNNRKITSIIDSEQGKRIVKKFIDSLPDTIKSLEDALEKHSIETLKDIFHQLKGVGGSVGFPVITELAIAIEASLESNDYVAIKNKVDEFKAICNQIVRLD